MVDGTAAFREYETADLDGCLAVFDTNVPRFFGLEERDGFCTFLTELPGPCLVMSGESGHVQTCGGYALNLPERSADFCWGMVQQESHGQGFIGAT